MTPLSRRQALGLTASALAVGLPSLVFPRVAEASLARAITLPDLAKGSSRIIRGTPVERYSEWQSAGGQKRIVTYSRVRVTEDIAAPQADSEILVMTWGGRVGDVAQRVFGEAALRPGEDTVLFLSGEHDGVRRVTAMAQGHYPIETVERRVRLQRSRQLDGLVRPSGSAREGAAVDTLHHQSFDDAKRLIAGALK